MIDSVNRFSHRVENYARYRPGYPRQIINLLEAECGLQSRSVVADIGSGTGLLTELFVDDGNQVMAIEPNAAMRLVAEKNFAGRPNFKSIDAMAEATTLPKKSADFVTAGQAFHWFDQTAAREEFRRVLKPDGWVVLIWNERRIDSTPFLRTYEQALVRYSIDYQEVRHENAQATVEDFFAPEKCHAASFANFQYFDLDGFLGRVNSSSYTPPPEHPNYQPLMDALQSIFKAHAKNGKVVFEYDTRVYYGHLPPRL